MEPELCCEIILDAPKPLGVHPTSISYSTLLICGWANGSPITLLCLCRLGVEFRKIGVGQSLGDVVMSCLRLQTCLECIPHLSYVYTVFQHLDMLWMGIWVHPYTVTPVQVGGEV